MDENNFQNFNPQMNDNMSFNQPGQYQQYQAPQPQYQQPIDNGFQPQPQPQPKKKKGGAAVLIIVLILLVALCGGAAAYYFLVVKSPKTAINTFLDNIDSKLGEASASIEGNSEKIDLKASISVEEDETTENANKSFIELMNNSDIEFTSGFDKAEKRAIVNLTLNFNNDPIEITLYFDSQSKGIYAYSKQILGKTIKIAEVTDDMIESVINSLSNANDSKNYVKAAQIILKTIKNNIKDNMITSSSAKFMANGKEVNATKNTIHLTQETGSELAYNISKELVNNSEFMNLFKDDIQVFIKKNLENTLIKYESDEIPKTGSNTMDFSVYTDGFIPKAVRYELTTTNEVYTSPNDTYGLSSYSSNSEVLKKFTNSTTLNSTTLVPPEEPSYKTSTLAVNVVDDNNYEIIFDNEGEESDSTINLKVKSDNKNSAEISISAKVKKVGVLSLNFSINRQVNAEIPSLSTTGATDINKLTSTDMQQLMKDLSSHELTKPVYSLVYLMMLSSTYQQGTGSYGTYPTTLPTTTNPGTTTTTPGTTSTVPAGKQKVGDKDFGYVLIPSNWTKFVDPSAPSTLQYSYANLYILTMSHVPTSSMSAYQYATSYATRMKSEGVDVKTATVKMGDYTAYQVYGKYESENTWLVAWIFETQDGQTRSLAVEGPDAANEAFKIPDTFTLE